MKITIIVKTNARHEKVETLPDGSYRVSVNCPPIEGRANEAVIKLLAEFFERPKSSIQLLHGEKGRKKVFLMMD
ncbi:MAG: DUF167 domain-containing protein [Deltaproteobacteria bacterium]|nr:DUF167 domain-containing protein [Deltaproteobacteria bacterium]